MNYIKPFRDIAIGDIALVGGKNASLGEMRNRLARAGVTVPDGFAVTTAAYRRLLAATELQEDIFAELAALDVGNLTDLAARARKIRNWILGAGMPTEVAEEIRRAYAELCREAGLTEMSVAVRSSATAEDLPEASFAGQQETYLNIRGEDALIKACHHCFASLFTDRAISYRVAKGFAHEKVLLSVGVQRMVRSDLASSGVLFTLDTESGFRDVVFLNASYGLGENVVRGAVNPDEFYVYKPTLKLGFEPIIGKTLGSKEIKMIYDARGSETQTRNVPVPVSDRRHFSLTDSEVLELARWGVLIEDLYGRPMDVEWAKDGESGALFVLQARPETVHAAKAKSEIVIYHLKGKNQVLAKGKAVGNAIGAGRASVIRSPHEIARFRDGDVLITEMTDPDWVPIMKRASAVVTERGGRTCHAAIISRELGLPAIVGAEGALSAVRDGQEVTASCAEGEEGRLYEGRVPFEVERIPLARMVRPRVPLMMNVADPERAFELSFLPNDGIGLARMEFIITESIGIHPMALVEFGKITDPETRRRIEEKTFGYADKPEYFVERLSLGIGRIAAAFYPKDVILRFSDFKTNEYAGLIGGVPFEPKEENPMLGFRGASRYYDPRYRDGFALECRAIRRVREHMGLLNLKVMVPFCRTVEEGKRVLAEMRKNGLERGKAGLEVYVMCEIPANVVLARDFAAIFDGFSIGSNDLTQLILGVDRDSAAVARLFDERNPAVERMIETVIREARAAGVKIGICGQAPSDYPEFAEFLINCGIQSLSLNPDAIPSMTLRLAEKNAAQKARA